LIPEFNSGIFFALSYEIVNGYLLLGFIRAFYTESQRSGNFYSRLNGTSFSRNFCCIVRLLVGLWQSGRLGRHSSHRVGWLFPK
jgi:hypothetical protein